MSIILDPHRREAARLTELQRLEAMRPEADRVLQDLVDDAREVFGARCCLVNLVTSDKQYFRAWSGDLPSELVETRRNPAGPSMCRHVVEDERPFVVEDFATTEQVEAQRLRMGPGVRFYAGTPLKTSGGHVIGSFCVLDGRTRQFGDRDSATLRAFAKAAVGRLEALGAAAQEREAKESERRYRRNVFELANDAIVIHGAETGLILDANRRACEVYDLRQEDLVGKKLPELSLEPEAEEEHSREVLRRGAHRGFETVHRRADGIPMDVSVNSSVTEYGGQRAILSIVRDVAGRKRTEEALRRSEKSLAQAQRIAHIGNWEHELGEHRTHWSDEMYRIFGFAPLALVPSYRTFIFFVHPDDKERVRRSIRGALHGNGAEDIEYRIVRPDGEVRFIHTQYEAAYDEGGRPTKFVGTVQDVTDRKRVEQKLEEAEERYRLLVEQIPAVAYIDRADVADVPFYTSPRIETLLGYTPEEWLDGRLWLERLHPDDRDWVLKADTRAKAAEEPFGGEYRLIAKDGRTVWVRDESELLRDEEGRPLLWQGLLLDITGRKQAEEALRRSEEQYRLVAQATNEVIWDNDLTTGKQEWNGAVQAMFGYSPEELEGEARWWEERIHPDDRRRISADLEALLEGDGEVWTEEYRFRRQDGTYATVMDRGYVVRDREGKPVRMLGSMMDITERKRTEEALHASEMRLRTVIEQSPLGIHIFAPDGTSLLANGAWDRLWYLEDEELGHANVFEDEQLREAGLIEHIERSVAEGAPVITPSLLFDPANVRREGPARWLRALIYPVSGEDGRALETVLLLEDVTERVRAGEALKESEKRYKAVIEQSAEAIWMFDPYNKQVLEANAAFQEMFGYDAEELQGMTNYDFVNHSREDVDRTVLRKLRGEKNLREERRYRTKDGTLLDVEVRGTVISYRGKSVVCSVARDITERKRVEEEIREANRRLSELATLKADFTAMVAHELDTPLAVIRGYADVMATGELGAAERERALSQIQSETEVLDALVGDVRAAASAERNDFTIRPRSVPVGGLLEDAARFVATLSKDRPIVVEDADDAGPLEGVRAGYADPFVFEGGADGPKVWADRYRIGQVLRNLLTNAVKYSPEGTPIELRAVPDEAAGCVRIEVVDHGPGIHPDDLERIFEKFGRGRDPEGRKVAGIGLGLYLSRRILRAHGSDLTVDAAPGDGSVFGFDLGAADV